MIRMSSLRTLFVNSSFIDLISQQFPSNTVSLYSFSILCVYNPKGEKNVVEKVEDTLKALKYFLDNKKN